ncbi:MAG: diguanylate cyclase [Clostridia bacterium]|nr:diguanylate cyclase [Clostridia bacterium]
MMTSANNNRAVKNKLKYTPAILDAILSITPDIIFVKDRDLRYVAVSQSFVEYTGKTSVDEIIGKTDEEIYGESAVAEKYRLQDLEMMVSGKSEVNVVSLIPDEDGNSRFGFAKKHILNDEDDKPIGIFGMIRETSKEYLDKQSYEQELNFLLDTNKNTYCLSLIDVDNWEIIKERRRTVNGFKLPLFKDIQTFCNIAYDGVADSDSDAFTFYKNFTKKYIKEIFSQGRRDIVMEYRRILPNGKIRWVQDIVKFLVNPENNHLSVALISRDIDARKKKEASLLKAAETDEMTGVLNRAAITKKITTFLGTEGLNSSHALFMLDIDNFKRLNDTLGHQEGDRLLVDLVTAVKACFRNTDLIGRVGGDEFFVLMKHCPARYIAEYKASALMSAVGNVCSAYKKYDISASVGISIYPADGTSLTELYKNADNALYYAKQHGKHTFIFAEDIK